MKTNDKIFEEMLDIIPFRLPNGCRKYILEAMDIYADQYKSRWISVKDRLPNENDHILIFYKDKLITDAYYEFETDKCYFFDKPKGVCYWEPTHWMPLPEKP